MPLQNFVDGQLPTIKAAWLNAIDGFYTTLFASATTAAGARTAISAAKSGANTDITSLAAPAIGAATATTQAVGTVDTTVATTAFVSTAVTPFGPDNSVCDFRLTLTTALPITTADVTGATTIYWTPYKGNRCAVYNGTSWVLTNFAQKSLALGTLTSGRNYDIFLDWNGSAWGLDFGTVWTDATTRAVALTLQDGVLGVAGVGGTFSRYIGTIFTSSTTQTEDSFAKRYLWNYYNRVRRPMKVVEATASWTYTTATFRQANGAAANQLDCVIGVAEEMVNAQVQASVQGSAARLCAVGIGVDSTSVNSAQLFGGGVFTTGTEAAICSYRGYPAAGRHTFPWLERSETGGTTTWLGTDASGSAVSGISGEVLG